MMHLHPGERDDFVRFKDQITRIELITGKTITDKICFITASTVALESGTVLNRTAVISMVLKGKENMMNK